MPGLGLLFCPVESPHKQTRVCVICTFNYQYDKKRILRNSDLVVSAGVSLRNIVAGVNYNDVTIDMSVCSSVWIRCHKKAGNKHCVVLKTHFRLPTTVICLQNEGVVTVSCHWNDLQHWMSYIWDVVSYNMVTALHRVKKTVEQSAEAVICNSQPKLSRVRKPLVSPWNMSVSVNWDMYTFLKCGPVYQAWCPMVL